MVYKISAPNDQIVIDSTVGIQLPRGTDGERPSDTLAGIIRYNTTSSAVEVSTGSGWSSFASSSQSGSTTLHGLTDVNVTEGVGIDGKYLKWDNTTNKWIASSPIGTGDITFNGVKIQGAGTAGEEGTATIELVPDTSLYTEGQYVIVGPGVPNHIHFKAGTNSSQQDLRLVLGEKTHVTVDNTGQKVQITTNTGSPLEFYGFINNDGTQPFNGIPGATLHVLQIVSGTITNGMKIYCEEILPDEGITVAFGLVTGTQGSGAEGTYNLPGQNLSLNTQLFYGGLTENPIEIWTFDSNGILTLPNEASIQEGGGTNDLLVETKSGNSILYLSDTSGNSGITGVSDVELISNGVGGKTWIFDTLGKLTLPTNGTIGYTPGTSGNWAGTAPTTIEEALDRIATAIKAINSTGA